MVTLESVRRFFNDFTPDFDTPKGDHDLNGLSFTSKQVKDAAVLILLIDYGPTQPCGVLLTQRTDHLSHHPGQISFPGGRCEDSDENHRHTALRETEEEVGLDPKAIEFLGALTPYLTRTGFRIHPMVGVLKAPYQPTVDPHEVAEVFEVPLAFLLNGDNHRKDTRIFEGKTRYFWAMPYENHYIWGATAGIIRDFYECMTSTLEPGGPA